MGIQPDPEKDSYHKLYAKCIMPRTSNPPWDDQLYTKYIPSLSTKNKPLGDLTKADPFIWYWEHVQTLMDLKSSIVSNTRFFNHQSKNVKLIFNASSHRLGTDLVLER
ncbi:hypothetical protein QYM36_015256 [Artemia franciscana]|uniref:Uncharacterized protein n=1 Tax=Artemia franciscana TaxID=6661 RepID=A0AA88KZ81_ARTSF|nr:hypothetical protein QYM36_015256 [Artemia franciscana]